LQEKRKKLSSLQGEEESQQKNCQKLVAEKGKGREDLNEGGGGRGTLNHLPPNDRSTEPMEEKKRNTQPPLWGEKKERKESLRKRGRVFLC